MSNDNNILVDQKLALNVFLDSLLREPQTELLSEPATTPTPAEKVVPLQEAVPVPVQPDIEVETATEQAVSEHTVEEPEPESVLANEFQVMLFKVAGLSLAVPLEELSGVVEWKNDLTEMPGHADFYMGIMQHLGKSVPVVDTARLIFPKDKLQALAGEDPTERVKRIVLIDEGRWGLAVDAVEEVITLHKNEVRWRSSRTTRKWLLGTVIEHMCALLDTKAFAEKLVNGSE